ncbi:MAG: hypothetical protein ACRDKZ_04010 [Actinomycetota bacterium]
MDSNRSTAEGVQFPLVGESRSSQATGREILAEAVADVDGELAARIRATGDWRKRYIPRVREAVAAGVVSSESAVEIAKAGLRAASTRMRFVRDGHESSVPDAFNSYRESAFRTATVTGDGSGGPPRLALPYRGERLEGEALLRQVDRWEGRGIVEPSCLQALAELGAHADWLDLSDVTVVLLGAASEMGPLKELMGWGATVIAVDLPRPSLWEHIVRTAKQGRGRLHAPVREPAGGDADAIVTAAGANLLTDAPEVRTWLQGFDGPMTIGNYVYSDGAKFVLLQAAVDALIDDFVSQRPETALAYLATPTDVYPVSPEIVEGARRRRSGLGPRAVRALSAGRLYADNYRAPVTDEEGTTWGISDCLVAQQGPNYALAKLMQRWRAISARGDGRVVSANLAPATNTRSVVKNKILSAAYAGAHRFGVEIFESDTSAALMAALLVHDLRNPKAAAHPETYLRHPYELWLQAAAHGGILRVPYEPRTVLPLAVLLGLPRSSLRG